MQFGPGLQPLLPYRDDLCVLEGLFNAQSVANPSAHLGRMPNLLSGAWVSLDQNDLRVGRTMDQVLAQRVGKHTALPSLVLGIEPTELRLEDGLSMLYGSCISWSSPTRPTTKEIYPSRAFDAIVGNRRQAGLDRTILDQVLADASPFAPSWRPAIASNWMSTWSRFATLSGGSTVLRRKNAWRAGGRRWRRRICPARPTRFPRTCQTICV
ncbi:MAG: hypothetical protein CM1200mP2_40530 [Planctomycetaceae bacterium]|nr:MAG: hypothetical protein CM1200mP2_40530 [Planctomycetaceae bacterium]